MLVVMQHDATPADVEGVCRTIVEMHDGRIAVTREGERTRVSVTLPVYEAKADRLANAA